MPQAPKEKFNPPTPNVVFTKKVASKHEGTEKKKVLSLVYTLR